MSTIIQIDLGTPNTGNGDPLRNGGTAINQNFSNLNADKLERGGYLGTAQDLKNEIDAAGSGDMLKATYDPTNKEQDVYDGQYTDIDNTSFKVLTGDNSQSLFLGTDMALLNAKQTGIRDGYLTLNGALGVATSFNTSIIEGEILDISDPDNPVYTAFTTPAQTNITPSADGLTYYFIDPANTSVLSSSQTEPTEAERRQRAYVFRVFVNGGVILSFDSERTLIQNNSNALRQLYEILGDGKINGLEVANTVAADLSFKTTSGVATGYDLSPEDYNNPHQKVVSEFNTNTGDSYRVFSKSGIDPTLRTQVLVDQYQDGAGALITVPNNRYSVWYITTIFATGVKYLVPADEVYTTATEAIDSLTTAKLPALSAATITETFCNGAIVTKKGVTDFLTGDVTFVSTNLRGAFGEGSGSQSATVGSYLEIANNLSDLADPATARTNLDLDNFYLRKDVADSKTVGDLNFFDNVRLKLGSSTSGFQLYHNSTNGFISINVGDLIFQDGGTVGTPTRFTFERTTGNLGVGVVPLNKLDVLNSDISFGGFRFRSDTSAGSATNLFYHRQDLNEIVFNEDGQDVDFRIEGVGAANLFGVDAANSFVRVRNAGNGVGFIIDNDSATSSPFMQFSQAGTRRSLIKHDNFGDDLSLVSEYGGMIFSTGTANSAVQRMKIFNNGSFMFSDNLSGLGTFYNYNFMQSALGETTIGIGALDGTNNPRVILRHFSSLTDHRFDFDSIFSTGSGFADFRFLNGKVAIGDITPEYNLDVDGIIQARDGIISGQQNTENGGFTVFKLDGAQISMNLASDYFNTLTNTDGGGTLLGFKWLKDAGNYGKPVFQIDVADSSFVLGTIDDGASLLFKGKTGTSPDYTLSNKSKANFEFFINSANDRYVEITNKGAGFLGVWTNRLLLNNLPTSSAGLSAGEVWNDAGTLKIV